MRALIRNPGETITEHNGIVGIDWNTGAPLTNESWAGGAYTLVEDYVPEDLADDCATTESAPESAQDPVIEEAPDTIVIDGVTYMRAS